MNLSNLPPGVTDDMIERQAGWMPELKRIKRIRSHTGHSRYLAECADDIAGWIARRDDIPSPYAYSPIWAVYVHDSKGNVIIRETSHRCYDVFALPDDYPVYVDEDELMAELFPA